MQKLSKQEYQKRALAISKLAIYLDSRHEPISVILTELMSPIGEEIIPYRWTDNQFLGAIERELKKFENGEFEE